MAKYKYVDPYKLDGEDTEKETSSEVSTPSKEGKYQYVNPYVLTDEEPITSVAVKAPVTAPVTAPIQPPTTVTETPPAALQEQSFTDSAKEVFQNAPKAVQENLDIGTGLAGGIAGGALLGSAFGPVGTVLGGVAGGALGTGGGELLEDYLSDEDLDYTSAVKAGLIAGGVDAVTLGMGSKIKTMLALRKAGKSVDEAVSSMADLAEAGSKASLLRTQAMVGKTGGTLRPNQVAEEVGFRTLADTVSSWGLITGEKSILANQAKVAEALKTELSTLARGGQLQGDLGSAIGGAVKAGKEAITKSYSDGLDTIYKSSGRKPVGTTPIKNRVDAFEKSYTHNGVLTLKPNAKKFLKETKEALAAGTAIPLKSLVELEKHLIQVAPKGSLEAQQLLTTVRKATLGSIARVDKKAAKQYSQLIRSHADGMNGLLPEVAPALLKGMSPKGFDGLGKLLTGSGSPQQAKAMMQSIETAYKHLGPNAAKELPYKTADEAIAAVKSSYIKRMFPPVDATETSLAAYNNLAVKMMKPENNAVARSVLGKDYARVHQVMNAMQELNKNAVTGTSSKFVSQEVSALRMAGSAAISVLGLPTVAGAIANSPKLTAQLLHAKGLGSKAQSLALQKLTTAIVRGMNTEEAKQFAKEQNLAGL